jgi:hypothetical protein
MSKTEFDVFCPQCNMIVVAKIIAEGGGGFRSNAINPADACDAEYHGEYYYVCECIRCAMPFLICHSLYGIPAEFESVTEEKQLYPSETNLPLEGIPTSIITAYSQATRSFSASLYEPCVIMCGKCLEATCKSFGIIGRTLEKKLEAMKDSDHIDSRLLKWAQQIRVIRNEAAHDMDISVEKSDARDILDFTEAILIYVFSLETKFKSFQERRNKSQAET